MIMTEFGVNIKYNILGNGSASIEVPTWYFGKLCGLCGDADGDKTNEYKLPNGNIVSTFNNIRPGSRKLLSSASTYTTKRTELFLLSPDINYTYRVLWTNA